MSTITKILESSRIIAAINDEKSARYASVSPCKVVFVLGCNICSLPKIVNMLNNKGKIIFVHIDLIEGLGKDTWAVEFLKKEIKPHGVISTRQHLIKHAKQLDMLTVQRMFLLDSSSIKSGIEMAENSAADYIELMPGVIPKAITDIKKYVKQPIIAGGMITEQKEADVALQAGAIAVSTSTMQIWNQGVKDGI
ncbi:MAG: glycerol-3-phosphate responsive antiterminator [Clostridia bacterium]|nr:glycerol-3-phosphate responsive antiterminator [Clostridia bacterium]